MRSATLFQFDEKKKSPTLAPTDETKYLIIQVDISNMSANDVAFLRQEMIDASQMDFADIPDPEVKSTIQHSPVIK